LEWPKIHHLNELRVIQIIDILTPGKYIYVQMDRAKVATRKVKTTTTVPKLLLLPRPVHTSVQEAPLRVLLRVNARRVPLR